MKNTKNIKEIFFVYVKDFIERNQLELKSEHTINSYRESLNDFRKYICESQKLKIDKITFDNINDELVRRYLKWLTDNQKSKSTRNARLNAIKQYIKFCSSKKVELIPLELSVNKIKAKNVKAKKNNWINKEQISLLLEQCVQNRRGIRDRFIMLFLFSTGARLSEMLNVKISDIAMKGEYPYILLTGKGNKTRVVPLTKEFIENVSYYLQLYHPENKSDEFLFYTFLKGQKYIMSEDNVQRIVKKYGNQAKEIDSSIPHMHPHIFRHSFGALMYRNGLSLPEIAKLMGHEQLSTTEIYAETDIDMINKALDKITNKDIDSKWETLSEDEKLKFYGLKK